MNIRGPIDSRLHCLRGQSFEDVLKLISFSIINYIIDSHECQMTLRISLKSMDTFSDGLP